MDFLTEYRKNVAAEIDNFMRDSYNNIADACKSIAAHCSAFEYSAKQGDFNEALGHLDKIADYFSKVKHIAGECARSYEYEKHGDSPLMKLIGELKNPPEESIVFKRGEAVFNTIKQEQFNKDDADNA